MKRFLKKTGIFFLPFIFIIALYFITDPFKVIYNYDFLYDRKVEGCVFLNSDYVAATGFEKNYNEFKYNSFIFGNSRSWAFRVSDWKKFIGDESCYHFTAAGEALYAIHKKIIYLDKKNVDLSNVLFVLDYGTLIQDSPKRGHLGIIAPQFVDYRNFFEFHLASLQGFFNIGFLFAYLDFKISGKVKPYMEKAFLIDSRPFEYNYKSNEILFTHFDNLISRNEYYTEERMEVFYQRDTVKTISKVSINQNQKEMLEDIFTILKKHNTHYKIIINPLYDQKYLADQDLDYLNHLFGDENVYDFSGINPFTNDYRNYYESSHYRPPVAEKILSEIYHEDHLASD